MEGSAQHSSTGYGPWIGFKELVAILNLKKEEKSLVGFYIFLAWFVGIFQVPKPVILPGRIITFSISTNKIYLCRSARIPTKNMSKNGFLYLQTPFLNKSITHPFLESSFFNSISCSKRWPSISWSTSLDKGLRFSSFSWSVILKTSYFFSSSVR